MTRRFTFAAAMSVAALTACQSTPETGNGTGMASATASESYVVDVVAEDYAFDAPDSIPSGWVTFRLKNDGEETHFLYVSRLPDGRSFEEYGQDVGALFDEVWQKLKTGELDKEGAGQWLGENIPEWYWTGVEVTGGPGMVAPGGTSQATVYLEPGLYSIECFMKTAEGEFHATEGMVRPLTVLAESTGAPEPSADVGLTVTTGGYALDGPVRPGVQTVRVDFAEQPEGGFGNDVHVARLEEGMDGEDLIPWMDAFNLEGLQNPAPATFVGGTHERAEGKTAYFTVDLEPGRYALISENADVAVISREITVE